MFAFRMKDISPSDHFKIHVGSTSNSRQKNILLKVLNVERAQVKKKKKNANVTRVSRIHFFTWAYLKMEIVSRR
jgi:hypothetical protein